MTKVTSGNSSDEFVLLAKSMHELFGRVISRTRELESFSDNIAHEVKNRLFEIQTTLEV